MHHENTHENKKGYDQQETKNKTLKNNSVSGKSNDVVVMKALTNNIKRHGIGIEKRKDRSALNQKNQIKLVEDPFLQVIEEVDETNFDIAFENCCSLILKGFKRKADSDSDKRLKQLKASLKPAPAKGSRYWTRYTEQENKWLRGLTALPVAPARSRKAVNRPGMK